MVFYLIIAGSIVLLYFFTVILFLLGIRRIKKIPVPVNFPPLDVTVVIPFRNEGNNLIGLARGLMAQDYTEDLYRVLFINDHSEDGSDEMLKDTISADHRLTCIDLPEDRQGKKEALTYGIEQCSSDYIIQTDGDCLVGPGFIRSHMALMVGSGYDLVAGLTTTAAESPGFTQAYERLDLLSLVASGAGSFGIGKPVLCSGSNLAYTRKLYLQNQKQDHGRNLSSGDDMFLMIGARKLGKKLGYNLSAEGFVFTQPVETMVELMKQRIRWGSKSVHYRKIDIQLLALLVVLTWLCVITLPGALILNWISWTWMAILLGSKTIADFLLLLQITRITDQRKTLWFFIPVTLLYYPVQILVLLGAAFYPMKWKERSLLVKSG
jgi:cellulose synthase/poly-beta-1,6-N-acetylglucosamine synthase-like glycosyltransferase